MYCSVAVVFSSHMFYNNCPFILLPCGSHIRLFIIPCSFIPNVLVLFAHYSPFQSAYSFVLCVVSMIQPDLCISFPLCLHVFISFMRHTLNASPAIGYTFCFNLFKVFGVHIPCLTLKCYCICLNVYFLSIIIITITCIIIIISVRWIIQLSLLKLLFIIIIIHY